MRRESHVRFCESLRAKFPRSTHQNSCNGYKLHIDTADCGVPVSVLLTSASVHDSQTVVPLATMTAARVTNLHDLMDAACCSAEIHEHSRSLGHVPLIDHKQRGGAKDEFESADAVRYKERRQRGSTGV
ncbi:MAG: tnp13 [Nevskia sp.]|nr:tnp13 [Nevskia sp.]